MPDEPHARYLPDDERPRYEAINWRQRALAAEQELTPATIEGGAAVTGIAFTPIPRLAPERFQINPDLLDWRHKDRRVWLAYVAPPGERHINLCALLLRADPEPTTHGGLDAAPTTNDLMAWVRFREPEPGLLFVECIQCGSAFWDLPSRARGRVRRLPLLLLDRLVCDAHAMGARRVRVVSSRDHEYAAEGGFRSDYAATVRAWYDTYPLRLGFRPPPLEEKWGPETCWHWKSESWGDDEDAGDDEEKDAPTTPRWTERTVALDPPSPMFSDKAVEIDPGPGKERAWSERAGAIEDAARALADEMIHAGGKLWYDHERLEVWSRGGGERPYDVLRDLANVAESMDRQAVHGEETARLNRVSWETG